MNDRSEGFSYFAASPLKGRRLLSPEAEPGEPGGARRACSTSRLNCGWRSAVCAVSRFVIAENSAIVLSAFAVSRAAHFSAWASWRFRLSFSAFRVST